MIFSTSSSEKTWNNSRRRSFCFLQQWPAEPLAGVVQFRWIVKPTWLVVTVVLASQHWARSRRWCHGEWYQISCLQVGGLHFQSVNIARSSDQSATGGHMSNGRFKPQLRHWPSAPSKKPRVWPGKPGTWIHLVSSDHRIWQMTDEVYIINILLLVYNNRYIIIYCELCLNYITMHIYIYMCVHIDKQRDFR